MSENLDLVRSIYAAIGRGDFGSADWADPEIEYVRADGVEPDSLIGRDGMATAMRSLFGALEDFRVEAEDYRELDAERVLVLTSVSARGKASGLPIVQKPTAMDFGHTFVALDPDGHRLRVFAPGAP